METKYPQPAAALFSNLYFGEHYYGCIAKVYVDFVGNLIYPVEFQDVNNAFPEEDGNDDFIRRYLENESTTTDYPCKWGLTLISNVGPFDEDRLPLSVCYNQKKHPKEAILEAMESTCREYGWKVPDRVKLA